MPEQVTSHLMSREHTAMASNSKFARSRSPRPCASVVNSWQPRHVGLVRIAIVGDSGMSGKNTNKRTAVMNCNPIGIRQPSESVGSVYTLNYRSTTAPGQNLFKVWFAEQNFSI